MLITTQCWCYFSRSQRRLWELRLQIWRPQIPELKTQGLQIPGVQIDGFQFPGLPTKRLQITGVQTKGLQIPGPDKSPGFGPRAGGQWVLKGFTHPNTSIRVNQAGLYIPSHYMLYVMLLSCKFNWWPDHSLRSAWGSPLPPLPVARAGWHQQPGGTQVVRLAGTVHLGTLGQSQVSPAEEAPTQSHRVQAAQTSSE